MKEFELEKNTPLGLRDASCLSVQDEVVSGRIP